MTVRIGDVALGAGRPAVIVPVMGACASEVIDQGRRAMGVRADLIEWRLDALGDASASELVEIGRALRAVVTRPVLGTMRTASEGGQRTISGADYASTLGALVDAGVVDAVDVELSMEPSAGDAVIASAHAAGLPVVGSSHDFVRTPTDDALDARIAAMRTRGVDIAKIAVMPRTREDVVRLLGVTVRAAADGPVITMAMGRLGAATRLVGGEFGSCATFATAGTVSAPGQLPADAVASVLDLLG